MCNFSFLGPERGTVDAVVGVDGRGEGGGADRGRGGGGARQGGRGVTECRFPII